MTVVDASVMIEMLLATELGAKARQSLVSRGGMRHAPHLLDVEVAQVLRKLVLRGQTSAERAQRALHDLEEFPLRRHGHASLLSRVFELRANHTAYDGIYLALSESLGASLLTCDAGLVKSPSSTAAVELVR